MIAGILENLIFSYQGPVFIHRVFFYVQETKKIIANFLCFHTFYASKKRNQRGEKNKCTKAEKCHWKKETAFGCREGSKRKNYAGQGSLQADRHQDGHILYDKTDEGR